MQSRSFIFTDRSVHAAIPGEASFRVESYTPKDPPSYVGIGVERPVGPLLLVASCGGYESGWYMTGDEARQLAQLLLTAAEGQGT